MMLRVDTRPRRRNAARPAEKDAPAYLKWLRGRSCFLSQRGGCMGKIEAAHVYGGGDRGMSTKCRDSNAIPMCSEHHRIQHAWGWKTFEANYGYAPGDAKLAADAYWKAWPGRLAWERKFEA